MKSPDSIVGVFLLIDSNNLGIVKFIFAIRSFTIAFIENRSNICLVIDAN